MKFVIFCMAASLAAVCAEIESGMSSFSGQQTDWSEEPTLDLHAQKFARRDQKVYPPHPVQYPPQYPVRYPPQYPVQYPPQYPVPYPPQYPAQNPPQYPAQNTPQYPPSPLPTEPSRPTEQQSGPTEPGRELPSNQDGSIKVRNDGLFTVLQFYVDYQQNGRKVRKDSDKILTGFSRIIAIPHDAREIGVTVQAVGLFDITSDIHTRQFKYPVIRCYSSKDARNVNEVGC